MSHHENLKIIAIVGMSGSGKSTAVKHFTEKGYPKVHFGNMAYEMMAERGIEKGEDNEKKFRVAIREEFGPDVYTNRVIEQVHNLANAGQRRVIIDGLYSWDEYKRLRHEFPGEMTVVAIVAPREKRYKMAERREDDRPQSAEISSQRDYNEIESLNKGGPIAMADYYVLNDGSLEDFAKQLDTVAHTVDF
jgi:dephospho-CoA kinase